MARTQAVPGLALAAMIAVPATVIGTSFPLAGAPAVAMVAGIGAGLVLRRRGRYARYHPGLAVAGRQVLQAGVVVLGLGLSLPEVAAVGAESLPVLLGTLFVALAGAWLLGRSLRLHPETSLLIGVGTGICGASAIAAVTSVVRPERSRVAYAMGTIFTFNLVAVAVYPALGRLLGLSDRAFGLWAGTAINDTSSVVAAAYAFGASAGDHAVVVKLARSLMIVPICAALHLWRARRLRSAPGPSGTRVLPLFIGGFLVASALATTGAVPVSWQPAPAAASSFLITTALAGVGAALDVRAMRDAGLRPLVFGGILGVLVGTSGLALQSLTGRL
ncbi:putative sulfate exporter family transporter [Microbispora hainanensis]|uniref:YeiH family protein n=1 Tax=Microbispora hainanensis TaxID=568844 RepID=UPI0033E1BEB2